MSDALVPRRTRVAPLRGPVTALRFLRRVARTPGGAAGLGVVTVLILIAVFAPLLTRFDPGAQDIAGRWQSPSVTHPLGTDSFGRDLLSRVMFGARIALGVAIPSVLLAMFVGLILGVCAGYFGGRVDLALLVVMDAGQSFPAVFLALLLV